MTQGVNNNSGVSSIDSATLGPSFSLQLTFAKLQSKELATYMEKNALAFPNADGDYIFGKDEWDVAITSLEGRLEQLGTDTQQQMVYIQDYMGQYNSYLQGANTQISNSNQTLTSMARGQ